MRVLVREVRRRPSREFLFPHVETPIDRFFHIDARRMLAIASAVASSSFQCAFVGIVFMRQSESAQSISFFFALRTFLLFISATEIQELCLSQEFNWKHFVMTNSYLYGFYITFILWSTVLAIPFNLELEPSLLLYNSSVPVQSRGINCFRQFPPELPPTRADCMKAIDKMLVEPDLMKVKTWTASTTHFTTREWKHGTCEIDVGAPVGTAEDRFSTWSCVAKAQTIVQKCLGDGQVGGRTAIGPKSLFQIIITHPREMPYSTVWLRLGSYYGRKY